MPTYAYRCAEGHEVETFHKMSEEGPERCEVCGKSPVERVLYPVAVHFKGSGFYSTDYGRGNGKREGSQDGDASTSGENAKTDKADKADKGDKADKTSNGAAKGKGEKKAAEA